MFSGTQSEVCTNQPLIVTVRFRLMEGGVGSITGIDTRGGGCTFNSKIVVVCSKISFIVGELVGLGGGWKFWGEASSPLHPSLD